MAGRRCVCVGGGGGGAGPGGSVQSSSVAAGVGRSASDRRRPLEGRIGSVTPAASGYRSWYLSRRINFTDTSRPADTDRSTRQVAERIRTGRIETVSPFTLT